MLLNLNQLTISELSNTLATHNTKAMTLSILEQLSSKEQLEVVGKVLPLDQILEFLTLSFNTPLQEKIAPIFVGMDQDRFEELLINTSDKQLSVLKSEGYSEAIIHHLTVLIHRLEKIRDESFISLEMIEQRIDAFDPNSSAEDTIHQSLLEWEKRLNRACSLIQKTLDIAWGTGNLDLIDKLNKVNCSIQRVRAHAHTLMNSKLTEKLFSVYTVDSNALKDDDPAIDGLANLSVWYLEDYIQVGLLSPETTLENHREKLFKQVKENLAKIGLCTVQDLKKASIFSKQTLKQFVMSKFTTS